MAGQGSRAGRWPGGVVDWQGGGLGASAGWPGEGPREKRPRSVRVVSPVSKSCVPGPRELCPRSVRVASQVSKSCVPGPRNVPGPATPERPKGRSPSPVPEKSADRGQYACGPETERLRTGDKNPTPSPARRRSWYPPSRSPSPAPRPQKTQTCGGACPAPSYRTFSSRPTRQRPGAFR